MKRILAILIIILFATITFSINFTETLSEALQRVVGKDELVMQLPELMVMVIPMNREYIDSGFAFEEATEIMKVFIGSNAMAFVVVQNSSPDEIAIKPDFISFDGKYGEYFISNDVKITEYIFIEPYSSNFGFLVVDQYSKYPVIRIADKYTFNYYTIYSEKSFIHWYIMKRFEELY